MEQDRKQRRSAYRRARRRPGDTGQIRSAQLLRNLIEMADEDPESELAQQLFFLLDAGRPDLVDKMKGELVRRAADREMKGKKFPFLKKPTKGELLLGNCTDFEFEGPEVRLPLSFLTRHVGILGTTGGGKSHFSKWLVMQLVEQDVTVVVFDVEAEYRELLPLIPRSKLWLVKPPLPDLCFRMNPFEPPEGEPPDAWIGKITDLVRRTFFMADGGSMVLSSTLKDLYHRSGCTRGLNNWPSLTQVRSHVNTLEYAKTPRKAGYQETLSRCLQTMSDGLGGILNCVQGTPISEVTKQSVIIDVSDLDPVSAEFFESLLLMKMTEGKNEKPTIIIFEEAHEVFNRFKQKRQSVGEPPLENLIRRLRKRNIGCFLVDQVPGLLPESAFGNLGTIVAFPIKNNRCRYTVSAAMGLNQQQADSLPKLQERTAIIQSQSPDIGRAILIRIPPLHFPDNPSLEETAAKMRPIIKNLPCKTVEQARQEAQERAELSLQQEEEKSRGVVSEETRELLIRSPHENLSMKALKYLEAWNEPENMFVPLTFFDKKYRNELDISVAGGNSIRDKLLELGLVKIEKIPTGKRGGQPETLRILKKGAQFLTNKGIKVNKPRGRGSFQAKAWSTIICRFYEKHHPGCVPRIEGRLGGKSVDVLVGMPDGEAIAVEVCMSPAWSTQNLTRDSVAGADKIVFAALKDQDIKRIREKIEKELGASELGCSMIEKAEYRLLREFL